LFHFVAHQIQGNLQGLFTQFARFILQLLGLLIILHSLLVLVLVVSLMYVCNFQHFFWNLCGFFVCNQNMDYCKWSLLLGSFVFLIKILRNTLVFNDSKLSLFSTFDGLQMNI
jgi:hypothetical protein